MTQIVVLKRQRVIEEKVIIEVEATDAADAHAAAKHLLVGGVVTWKYNKTLEISEPEVSFLNK